MREARQSGALEPTRLLEVLYVEDNEFCASMLSHVLASCARIQTVPSVEDALSILKTLQFDLVIVDLGLPGLSGFEAVRALHAATETPIMIYTGRDAYGEELIALKEEAARSGADGYIVKGAPDLQIRCDMRFIVSAHHRRQAERLLRGAVKA